MGVEFTISKRNFGYDLINTYCNFDRGCLRGIPLADFSCGFNPLG